ncbi:MAG: type 1 glutamine amidotransferase [Desulfomicrobiaceae bacterium]|nr:type 1 glutamine amidotransferase [Desulfomicrobiaceae bacterium]
MELTGRKVMIFVEEMYNDYEYIYPYYRLLEAGAEVAVVGPAAGAKYTGKAGTTAVTTLAAAEAKAAEFAGLVIPGGYAPDMMRRHPAMVDLVRQMDAAGKVVAAICHAGWMLASAKILRGRTVTSFFAIRDDLEHAGATWIDQEVVQDGNLITSRTPADLPAFMRAVVAALRG